VAFSRDGTLLATGGADGTVRLWNTATRRPVGAPLHASARYGVDGVAFSPTGTLLASVGGDKTVRLWNTATRRPVGGPHRTGSGLGAPFRIGGGCAAVAFSRGGKLLAAGDGDGTVRLWVPVTGQPTRAPIQTGSAPYGGVWTAAFSPDGTLLATALGNGTVRL